MSKKSTGTLRGNDLILTRSFKAPIADVWTSVTKSEHTERWFGRWEGDVAVDVIQAPHAQRAPALSALRV